MSFFQDLASGLALYEAPKNGGTTLRIWIAYRLTGQLLMGPARGGYYMGTSAMTDLLVNAGYSHKAFVPLDCRRRICVKRDPVERFLSCFEDKILKQQRRQLSLAEFLANFEDEIEKDAAVVPRYGMSTLAFHFLPQTYHFGRDADYYDEIFTVAEVGSRLKEYLQDAWGIELPNLHARHRRCPLNRVAALQEWQVRRIQSLYHEDYQNGWC